MEAWKKKSVQNIKDMSKKKGKKTPKETTILAHKKTIGAFNDKDKEYEEILARAERWRVRQSAASSMPVRRSALLQ